MGNPGRNEGFRMLEEFTCQAISESHASHPGRLGRGVTPGMDVVAETVFRADTGAITAERVAELRGMSSSQLLALVKLSGRELDGRELLAIHDIAAERLSEVDRTSAEVAIALSREAMLVAVNRCA